MLNDLVILIIKFEPGDLVYSKYTCIIWCERHGDTWNVHDKVGFVEVGEVMMILTPCRSIHTGGRVIEVLTKFGAGVIEPTFCELLLKL